MATLVAIGCPDQVTAEQARATVQQLESERIIQADQVASISRDEEGKYHVHTTHGGSSTGAGAVWGGFWGLLFGLLFFIPFAGWAVTVIKTSLSEEDTKKLQEALQPPSTVGAAS